MSLESDIQKLVESIGLTFYDAVITSEHEETIYRVSVTAPEGVSLDKCVEATQLISPLLDVTPPVSGEYRLEVSSPGIERPLKRLDHFANSVGEKVNIKTLEKEKIRGELIKVDGTRITVKDAEHGEVCIDFDDVSKAKTYFEW